MERQRPKCQKKNESEAAAAVAGLSISPLAMPVHHPHFANNVGIRYRHYRAHWSNFLVYFVGTTGFKHLLLEAWCTWLTVTHIRTAGYRAEQPWDNFEC